MMSVFSEVATGASGIACAVPADRAEEESNSQQVFYDPGLLGWMG
jgi:hypothetical protein